MFHFVQRLPHMIPQPIDVRRRVASRPYFVQPHTPSSGFRSGTYPGKSSATTSGCSASHAFTSWAWLWIWLRSQITVNGPRRDSRSHRARVL